jgi:hypothetical protein
MLCYASLGVLRVPELLLVPSALLTMHELKKRIMSEDDIVRMDMQLSNFACKFGWIVTIVSCDTCECV